MRYGVGDVNFAEYGVVQALDCLAGEYAVGRAGPYAERSVAHKHFRSLAESARRVNHIVHDNDVLSLDFSYSLDFGNYIGLFPGFVADDDSAFSAFAERLRVGVGPLCASHVRCGDGKVAEPS